MKIWDYYIIQDNTTGEEYQLASISGAAYLVAFFEMSSVTVYGYHSAGTRYPEDDVTVKLATYQDGKQIWKPEPWESFCCGKHTVIEVPVPKSLGQIRKATKPGAKRTFCDLAVQMGASVTR